MVMVRSMFYLLKGDYRFRGLGFRAATRLSNLSNARQIRVNSLRFPQMESI